MEVYLGFHLHIKRDFSRAFIRTQLTCSRDSEPEPLPHLIFVN